MRLDHIQLAMPEGGEDRARGFFIGILGRKELAKPPPLDERGGCWFTKDGVQIHVGVKNPFTSQAKGRITMKTINWILVSTFFALSIVAQEETIETKTQVGPKNGSLLIVGGGGGPLLLKKFIELAGGNEAPIIFITTANPSLTAEERELRADRIRQLGASNVTVLHTTDPKQADTNSFVSPLKTATGVWFGGGRQWRLVDAYKNTQVEALLWDVLRRGGVIGGSSAGATIQGSYLARGDTRNNQIMVGDHEEGFGFLKNVAIDQHHLARNRHFDMFSILKEYPHLLGLGIDENTAIVVKGDIFNVIGNGYVAVYDRTFWSREGSQLKNLPDKESLFYFLRAGDRYDLKNRKVLDRKIGSDREEN